MRSRQDGGGGKAEALLASSRNHGKTNLLTKPDKGIMLMLCLWWMVGKKVDSGWWKRSPMKAGEKPEG